MKRLSTKLLLLLAAIGVSFSVFSASSNVCGVNKEVFPTKCNAGYTACEVFCREAAADHNQLNLCETGCIVGQSRCNEMP